MKLKFLGTGTSQGVPVIGCYCPVCTSSNPKDRRYRSSVIITTDSDKKILIDCGPDFRNQMLENNEFSEIHEDLENSKTKLNSMNFVNETYLDDMVELMELKELNII